MIIPQGLGFYIWKLSSMPAPNDLLALLKEHGVSWVAIKIHNGLVRSNLIDNSDDRIKEYISVLKAGGIHVIAWGWIFPPSIISTVTQANLVNTLMARYGLDEYLIDAEHIVNQYINCPWYTDPARYTGAQQFMDTLSYTSALSSYRFPTYFPNFPFRQFLNGRTSSFVAPQVYWQGAHNPGAQLQRSLGEYNSIKPISELFPMVPIGSAYGSGSWEPTVNDLKEFVSAAKALGCPGWGFWSLDWILEHNKQDWLDAVAEDGVVTPPPPPEFPKPAILTTLVTLGLNVRHAPSGEKTGNLTHSSHHTPVVMVFEEKQIGNDVWVRIGEDNLWCAMLYQGREYLRYT